MRRWYALIGMLALMLVGVLAAGSPALLDRWRGQRESTLPPCSALPTSRAVESALAQNADLAAQLRAAGGSVTVHVSHPCGRDDRAAVAVECLDEDCARVGDILTGSAGFGVPVKVVPR